MPERLRQAVSKAEESKGRARLHIPCAIPAASVQDRWHAHGAMVALGHAHEAMNEHIKCSFCGLLWSGHERVSMRVYMHVGERGRLGVKGGVHKERAVCILDV